MSEGFASRSTSLGSFVSYQVCPRSRPHMDWGGGGGGGEARILIPFLHVAGGADGGLGAGGPAVLGDDPPGVDDAGQPAKDRQGDVDQEVGAAAGLEEDRDGRQEEGQEVQEHVAR